ncbi:hypothetical protein [Methylosinus sp. 3S-1]|uniref:hypothetical protein n=1 Tax=Methylosinus sp. 3S-1 TaxID=1849840 RepID=UPI003F669C3E
MRLVAIACGVAVAASLIFGGTSRDGVPAIMVGLGAAPLLVALLIEPQALARARAVLAPLVLVVAIPLLQLVPLPPMLWQILPGRAPIVETYAAASLPLPWLAISIAPGATERSLLALVAPLAIFLGALACRREERRGLFGLVLLAGAGSALLEFLQIMDGPDSALRFYPPSDGSVGVGVFANRNHAAALLYCAIPIAAVALDLSRGRRPALRLAALAGFYLALVLGLMMTGSRSALILGAAAFVMTAALILRESLEDLAGERRSALLASAGFAVAAILLAPAFGLTTILDRLTAQEAGAGDRASLARISFDAARSFFPFGSGSEPSSECFRCSSRAKRSRRRSSIMRMMICWS